MAACAVAGFASVVGASVRIRPYIHRTPVLTSNTINGLFGPGTQVFFKCENFQKVGAFKYRGACNALLQLSCEQKRRGVVTHSSGNHAQALSCAARTLGVDATVVMPLNAPCVKVDATRGYGATVVRCESTAAARESKCNELIAAHGFTFVPPYDHPHIIHGAGTAALELLEETGQLDTVVAPVGGGGLLSGTALAVKGCFPDARVIAAEPVNADDAARGFASGRVEPVSEKITIADGLRTPMSELTHSIMRLHVDGVEVVPEDKIIAAMRLLWERMKLVVEPSGAVPLAAALQLRKQLQGKRIGIIISGGNVDLAAAFERFEQEATSNLTRSSL